MLRVVRFAALLVLAVVLSLTVTGCRKEEAQLEPTVAPPVIGQEGVLRVGVDLDSPPFAGTDQGRQAGIDVDVAAAMAERLGLRLELLDVKPDAAGKAVTDGDIDIVMSVALTDQALKDVTIAGTYLDNAPALFATVEASRSVEPSLTVDAVAGKRIAAQEGALAFWLLEDELGEDSVQSYPTLREAFTAANAAEADFVAGDAVTGLYIARDFPGFVIVGQAGPATRIGVGVSPDNTRLEETVRDTLDELAADGVISTITQKWVGTMPEFELPSAETTTQ